MGFHRYIGGLASYGLIITIIMAFFIEKSPLKCYITEEGVSTKKAKMNSIKNFNSDNWSSLSQAEKKQELYRRQKDLLDTFLATGAISQAQHDKSLNCLIEKMGIKDEDQ